MATVIPITQALQPVDGGAAVVDFVDVVDDMVIPANDGLVTLEVYNPTALAIPISFAPVADITGRAYSPESINVVDGGTVIIGPFPPAVYNQPDGTVQCGSETPGLKVRGTRI